MTWFNFSFNCWLRCSGQTGSVKGRSREQLAGLGITKFRTDSDLDEEQDSKAAYPSAVAPYCQVLEGDAEGGKQPGMFGILRDVASQQPQKR